MGLLRRNPRGVRVEVSARSDVGRSRTRNEDRFLVADLTTRDASLGLSGRKFDLGPKGSILLVADGMGGALGGEVASQMAVDLIYEQLATAWAEDPETSAERFQFCVRDAIERANTRIHERSNQQQELHGMGSTATLVGLFDGHFLLNQVGDSRAYLVRKDGVVQLTHDQSFAQHLLDTGRITERQASEMGNKNIILQALGPAPTITVVQTLHPISRGDIVLLCSDGLTRVVEAAELQTTVLEAPNLPKACDRLVDLANARGGPDNITVVLAELTGNGLPLPEEDDTRLD